MVMEYNISLEGRSHPVVISDEPEALLAAKAAGRAIIGVENDGNKWNITCAHYIIPDFTSATRELAELVLRRHIGLPWIIGTTERLIIREFVKDDAVRIPREEYGMEENVFRSPELMAHYIEKQYGFYEYGTWALEEKESGALVGMAGVSNPRLPKDLEEMLRRFETGLPGTGLPGTGLPGTAFSGSEDPGQDRAGQKQCLPWLELGYHIFRPFRRMGYAGEAVVAIRDYAHEVLEVRLCAMIQTKNQASRAVAEGLGMECISGTGIQSSEAPLLYAERWTSRTDKAGS
ncbi:GNAT family N-acetyltransferase [Lachnoclostridium pacaense]|uniref:GNAT family N-acetyltransferase n=1 Tax=Enterocloster hominis (ex Hitch et al. 2024) TaxID=1917870 RepID=UPI001D122E77|nr:GNAT family N-acetyltransferase [Lachnoclostridium pacaense]MCC2817657.1 GNAT family N-acetyltransferase [Lachnoclostridium pacaense]